MYVLSSSAAASTCAPPSTHTYNSIHYGSQYSVVQEIKMEIKSLMIFYKVHLYIKEKDKLYIIITLYNNKLN